MIKFELLFQVYAMIDDGFMLEQINGLSKEIVHLAKLSEFKVNSKEELDECVGKENRLDFSLSKSLSLTMKFESGVNKGLVRERLDKQIKKRQIALGILKEKLAKLKDDEVAKDSFKLKVDFVLYRLKKFIYFLNIFLLFRYKSKRVKLKL